MARRTLRSTRWLWLAAARRVARLAPGPARAVLELDITEGVVEPLPIAISEFYGGDAPTPQQRGREIADVVSADLERSGLFRPIDRRAFIQSPEELRGLPRFADWRQINAQALVTGDGQRGGEPAATLRGRVPALGRVRRHPDARPALRHDRGQLAARGAQDRRCGLRADHRRGRPTSTPGSSMSPRAARRTDRVKRLAIMDQDGANHRFLTDGADLVLTPRFHPDADSIAYMAYRGRRAAGLSARSRAPGARRRLGDFAGMTFAPHFAPDGRRLAMSPRAGRQLRHLRARPGHPASSGG